MPLSSVAAPIVYGDFLGATVDYIGVFENNNEDGGNTAPLFGRPTVLGPAPVFPAPCVTCAIPGNSLDFTPQDFSASSSNGGSDITDSQLGFMIVAHSGVAIETITLTEAGDTSLLGLLPDSDAFTSVTASGTININEVDGGGAVVAPLLFDLDFVLLPSNTGTDATWSVSGDSTNGFSYFTLWEGSVVIDIEAYLNDQNVDFDLGATKLTLTLDNTLNAASQEGASAVISKKDFGGVTFTVNEPGPGGEIPEPSSLVLVGLSLAGLFVGRRRG